jgi:hypothetical protein
MINRQGISLGRIWGITESVSSGWIAPGKSPAGRNAACPSLASSSV